MTTEDQIIDAIRDFLLSILSGVEVVRGQVNRVPEPTTPDFIIITPTLRVRSSTNIDTWQPVTDVDTMQITRGTILTAQLDIHGPNSADNAQIVTTLWRDDYGTSHIDPAIFSPLYANDGHQAAFVNGEMQYEDRWTVDVVLHAQIALDVAAQFADVLTVGLVEVDTLLL